MVTKSKAAAKPAAKQATATVEAVAAEFEVGQTVAFLGYAPDTPDDEQVLTAGESYEIVGFTEAEGDSAGGDPILSYPNPEFNAKKKENPETNPKTLEVQVFDTEIEAVEEGDEDQDAEDADAEEEEEAAPEPVKAKGKAAPAKAKAAPAKAAPAKAAPAKAKAAAKTPKVKPPKAVKPPKDVAPDPLDMELENEDEEVLALIKDTDDLISVAQQLEAQSVTTDWQLGGILYHVRKEKPYLDLDDGAKYKEPTKVDGRMVPGFEAFLNDYFQIEYRKAMYLIKIYVSFTKAGITNAAEAVAKMGWTKAKTIAPLMLEDDSKPDELIELANNNTVSDLSETIKEMSYVGGTKGTPVVKRTIKLRFLEEEGNSINAILETAREQLGLKTIDQAAAQIINEWASANAGKPATKASAPMQKAGATKVVSGKKVAPAAPRRVAAATA